MAAHPSEPTLSAAHDTNERRPAIWPWLLMPMVVLIVFYTLKQFEDEARTAAAAQSQTRVSTTTDTSEQ